MKRVAVTLAVTVPLAGVAHARPSSRSEARIGTVLAARATAGHLPAHLPVHGPVHGSSPHAPVVAHAAPRPAPPLPMLPSVARVRVEAARDRVVVIEEVNLPRGDWESGGLDLFVAFGAPGTPLALDARLAAVPIGSLESRADDVGEVLSVDSAVRHLPNAQLLLGRPTMAGVVVHVKDAQLRHAYALSNLVTVRIRSLLSPPAVDASGTRDVVVRLGFAAGQPVALEKVQIVSAEATPWITGAEATLCGPEADPWPLSLTLLPHPADPRPTVRTILPVMAVRHASDDLCIRWSAP
jgi:hypothetical protein